MQRPNWRRSYHENYVEHRDRMLQERARGSARKIELDARRVRRVSSLSIAEIEAVAWRLSALDTERAINMVNRANERK